jgi:hypothetical protein
MLEAGTEVFIERAGSGFMKVQGYSGTVLTNEQALKFKEEGVFIEGLDIDEEGVFFVEIHGFIYEDDEGENSDLEEDERTVEYECGSIWAVRSDEKTRYIIKNIDNA